MSTPLPTFSRRALAVAALVMAPMATLVGASPLAAQDSTSSSYTIALNQDNFFGFYPTFAGTYTPSKKHKVDVAFYGTLWTIPAFNVGGAANGANLWTEFGVGARFRLADDRLAIKPQLGITNGSLLSGAPTGGSPNVFDGIVPSLTVNYASTRAEGEVYSGYYRAAREVGPVQLDFLHYWANAGVKFASIASVGVHVETLRNSRTTAVNGSPSNTYRWVGGYLQFALPHSHAFARLTAGSNVNEGATGGFYKLSTGLTF
ncbi:DUF6733 family protein [Gemmatimonas sp.]|uniref:DUF6733 family protein n=1 Tax=Gemmatimonas sp. TaxID=1962908 RepID=UPI0037C128BE